MYIFPTHLLNPTGIKAGVRVAEISGGTALNGDETTIQTDGGGRWEVAYSGITLRSPQMIRKWDAWTSYMPGKAFLVPLVSLLTAPRPHAGGAIARPSSITADDDYFPENVRYAVPQIIAETVGNAPIRATRLTINVIQGARVEGGEKFSINGRGFIIDRVLSKSGQRAEVMVSPPTREAIPASSTVNFDWPVVQCKIAQGQDLAAPLLFGRRSEMSIVFVEDFSDAR